MRTAILLNIIAIGAAALLLVLGDWVGALAVTCILATCDIGASAITRAGARARQALRDETRLHNRARPVGVTVDFAGVLEPVPCEVVADGDVENGEAPTTWLARPHSVPEGAGPIRSFNVAVWPSGHSLIIEGLDV